MSKEDKPKGPVVSAPQVKVEGMAVIRDKDGNIKGRLRITNLEEDDDGIKRHGKGRNQRRD
jgi:hypothetical protein